MKETLDILTIDDHKLFSAGLTSVLSLLSRPVRVKEIYNGTQALSELEANPHYDLVLIDLEMPSIGGIDLLKAMRSRGIEVKVAVVSGSSDVEKIQKAINAGAKGYIPKTCSVDMMVAGIEKVLNGQHYVPDHLRDSISFLPPKKSDKTAANQTPETSDQETNGPTALSVRQTEILELMQEGKTNKQIADILAISQSTVKFHIAALFKAFGVRTRTECVHVARQHLPG